MEDITVKDIMKVFIENNCPNSLLAVEYLVKERNVVTLEDSYKKILWYFQPKFEKKMNEYLEEYKKKKEGF